MKLLTWRVAGPAPLISIATSSAGRYAGSKRRVATADGRAISAGPSIAVSRTSASIGRYAQSVTRSKTDVRPWRSKRRDSTSTRTDPASGSTAISTPAVTNSWAAPAATVRTRSPV